MKIFNFDNSSGNFTVLVDILFTGILWLLCCIPIVTIGPASTALYYAIVKSVRHGRGYAGREFFGAFKANLKSSLIVWLLYLLLIALWLGGTAANGSVSEGGMMGLLSLLLIIPFALPLPWVFAYISRFENSVADTMKFSLLLSVKNLARTVLLLMTAAAFALVAWMFPALIPLLPGFCCLVMSFQTEPVFKLITQEMDSDGNEDKWYNE